VRYCDMLVRSWGQGPPSYMRLPLPQLAAAMGGRSKGEDMFTAAGGIMTVFMRCVCSVLGSKGCPDTVSCGQGKAAHVDCCRRLTT
jgi:hypothetical protein